MFHNQEVRLLARNQRPSRSASRVGTTSSSRLREPEQPDLIQLARVVWSEAPLLAVIDVCIALGAAAVAAAAVVAVALAPFVAALLLGPVWIAAVASCERIRDGNGTGVAGFLGDIRRHGRTGAALALVPATVAALLIGSVELFSIGQARGWMLAPIALDAAVLIVLGFGSLAVFPLAVTTSLSGRDRWFAAIAWAGRHLIKSLGVAAITILLALSVRLAGPVLVFIAAAPLCLIVVSLTRPAGWGEETPWRS